ncbi:MAG: TonB-dependent receptor, partial [Methylomonas sp.]
MPFNMKLSLDHRLHDWQSAIEMQFVDGKSDVQFIRNETTTPSYILLNARTGYEWNKTVRLDIGLDNVLDKQYYYPLAGAYLGGGWGMSPTNAAFTPAWGNNVPGMGRSAFVGLSIKY